MYHIYAYGFSGIAALDEQMLEDSGFELIAGRLADGSKDEMVISSYVAQTFIKAGYREYGSEGSFTDIQDEADMVGKTLYVGGRNMEIVGVVDTGFDLSRYESLVKENKGENSLDLVLDVALNSELRKARECSFLEMMMVGDGFVERMLEESPKVATVSDTDFLEFYTEDQKGESAYYLSESFYSTLGNLDASKVVWADGAKETLAENEIIISQSSFEDICNFLSLEAKPESLAELPNITRSGYCESSVFDDSEDEYSDDVKIVGYLPAEDYEDVYQKTIVIDDELYKKYMGSLDGGYSFAIGAMPDKYSEVKSIVKYSYSGKNGVRYSLVNSVTYELDGLDEVFKVLSKAFMYVGLFFAIFASIMMATFISSSISYKKQEIGILRAIGARGSDVFRIFFSESFLIAMINFVLSTTGVGIATALVNRLIRRSTGLLITVLRFGIRQVILLFVISMAIAALASFFPVNHNARKRPIDAIRNR
ncbi:MAG: FtsX-like permease family protein [Lachnospiraceae bacterium]|nr:FtsX-like permease family protein [Lachnospiraceae bacterium]